MKNTRTGSTASKARSILPSADNPSDRDFARLDHHDLPAPASRAAWAEREECARLLARLVFRRQRGPLAGHREAGPVFAVQWLGERLDRLQARPAGQGYARTA